MSDPLHPRLPTDAPPAKTPLLRTADRWGSLRRDVAASVASGAGHGLLAWLGISIAVLGGRGTDVANLARVHGMGLGLGIALVVLGAGVRPTVAGRTAWPKRARLGAVLVAVLALALSITEHMDGADPALVPALASLLAMATLASLLLQALGAGDGATTRAWTHPLRIPDHVALSLLGGAAALFSLFALLWKGPMLAGGALSSLVLLTVVSALMLALYWHETGGLVPRAAGPRAGVPDAAPSVPVRQRWMALLLLVVVPVASAALPYLLPHYRTASWLAALAAILVGTWLERRLLFATPRD